TLEGYFDYWPLGQLESVPAYIAEYVPYHTPIVKVCAYHLAGGQVIKQGLTMQEPSVSYLMDTDGLTTQAYWTNSYEGSYPLFGCYTFEQSCGQYWLWWPDTGRQIALGLIRLHEAKQQLTVHLDGLPAVLATHPWALKGLATDEYMGVGMSQTRFRTALENPRCVTE
ncbi:hypothetical protein K493DRAFT_300, partial [Basidiobolus meristosporus CBS 931.73]